MAKRRGSGKKVLLKILYQEVIALKKRVLKLEKKTKYCDGESLPADAAGSWDD